MAERSHNFVSNARPLSREIIALILGEADKPTLAVCTLVCRSWLEASRLNLFESIFYRPQYLRYTQERGDVPRPLEGLTDFMISNPKISQRVRHLSLGLKRAKWTFITAEDHAGVSILEPCRWEALITLLSQLPGLHTLDLENFLLDPLGPPHDPLSLSAKPSCLHLKELTFSRLCRAQDKDGCLGEMLHLISLFERVDRLTLGAFFSPPTNHTAGATRIPTNIGALVMHPQTSSLLASLVTLPDWAFLERLALPRLPPANVPDARRLVNHARGKLRAVELRLPHINDPASATVQGLRVLALEDCPRLEVLTFTLPIYGAKELLNGHASAETDGRPYFTTSAYLYITQLLASCSSTLRHVTLELEVDLISPDYRQHMCRKMLQMDWEALDHVFATRVENGLASVEFRLSAIGAVQVQSSKVETYFAERMPLLWATKIAHFVYE